MRWTTLTLVALSGCDYVFSIDHLDTSTAACGPYSTVKPVVINDVIEPRQFSISEDEQLALVFGTDMQGRTRPIPLAWTGDAWQPHSDYQVGLEGRDIEGARLAPSEEIPVNGNYIGAVQPAMNVWIVNNNRHQVTRFYWSGTAWTADPNQATLFDAPDYDMRAGNVVLVRGSDPADRVRHTVITKFAVEVGVTNQILLHANAPPAFNLLSKPDRTRALNEDAVATHAMLGDAVLTASQSKLVYTVVSGGQSDLYASEQSTLREFGPGGLIPDITTANDEVEPWINATCSKLYFRRIPAGSSNDPGQILVAE